MIAIEAHGDRQIRIHNRTSLLQWLTTYSILFYVLTLSGDWRGYRVRLTGFPAR